VAPLLFDIAGNSPLRMVLVAPVKVFDFETRA
jgi:hypothetical protein